MLSLLESIGATIAQFGQLVLFGVVEALNLVLEGVNEIFSLSSGLLSLPTEPTVPSLVEGINWFFPVGTVISIGTTLAASYGSFLAVRWIFKKAGTL